jgi:ParB-like chromosome segregation protein Spo0J
MEADMSWTEKHPVSHVRWVPTEQVHANDYNPNAVAPPEMRLLRISIEEDGFTQPIVVWQVGPEEYEVVDGFHRHLVGRELGMTHLPVVVVNQDRIDRGDRIASTIRHNRARGKHQVGAMSEIVQELARRNWSNEKIGRELGMEPDEVLRLKQISGLAELFADQEFSEAWEANDG